MAQENIAVDKRSCDNSTNLAETVGILSDSASFPRRLDPCIGIASDLAVRKVQSDCDILVEASLYIRKYRNQPIIMKVGGSLAEAPHVLTDLAHDAVFMEAVGMKPVLVHGGGIAISTALEEAGIKSVFVNGHRRTTEKELKIVEQVLCEITHQIANYIEAAGGKVQRFNGTDLFICEQRLDRAANGSLLDLGKVGTIVHVNVKPVQDALKQGVIPVVNPIAVDIDGQRYNVNADSAATALALALRRGDEKKQPRLLFFSDVPGVLRDINDPSSVLSNLKLSDIPGLVADGTIGQKMLPKIDGARAAAEKGLRISIIPGQLRHAALIDLFTDKGAGTMLINE